MWLQSLRLTMTVVFLLVACGTTFGADTILASQYVSKTVHIPGGRYASPYQIVSGNTQYVLDGDIVADGTAIVVNASKVVIDLNGHTIRYNETTAGCGISSGNYNYTDVAIINGTIVQGAAMTAGGTYGLGSNPIRFHSGTPASYNVSRVQIQAVTAVYGSRDVGGFQLGGDGHIVSYNNIQDTYEYGTLSDRHSGVAAIKVWGKNNEIHDNTITNARHRGIDGGAFDQIYNNNITIRSICTNSYGIFVESTDTKIFNNTIFGRGEHPIGIGAHNSTVGASANIEIYGNTIDVQVTRLGVEYGGGAYPTNPLTTVNPGDVAVGIRSTSGTTNTSVHDNKIIVRSDADFLGTWSPDGRTVRMSGGARGIMAGLRYNSQSSSYNNNTIEAVDRDGTGYAVGIACDANIDNNAWYTFRPPAADFSPNLQFTGNNVTSNVMNIALGDAYGPCSGYPLFLSNNLSKSGAFAAYATYGSGNSGYYEGTAKLISNTYQNGASEGSLNMYFQSRSNNVPDAGGSYKNKSLIFGRVMAGLVQNAYNTAIANIQVRVYDSKNTLQTTTSNDASGKARFIIYDYNLNNNLGTTGDSTPIRIDYKPHTLQLFDSTTAQTILSTSPDSSVTAWDSPTAQGPFLLKNSNYSFTISTDKVVAPPQTLRGKATP